MASSRRSVQEELYEPIGVVAERFVIFQPGEEDAFDHAKEDKGIQIGGIRLQNARPQTRLHDLRGTLARHLQHGFFVRAHFAVHLVGFQRYSQEATAFIERC